MLNLPPTLREVLGAVLRALGGERAANRVTPLPAVRAVVRYVRRERRTSVTRTREGAEL